MIRFKKPIRYIQLILKINTDAIQVTKISELDEVVFYLDSPADRLSRDLRREGARERGDRDRDRDLRVFGGDSRSLFKLKSSNLSP